MAKTFTATTPEIRKAATDLNSSNAKFKRYVEELVAKENSLNSMWDGEANDAFHKAFQSDVKQLNKFYELIKKYVKDLQEIAKKYEDTEKKALGIASKRSYK